MTAAPAKRQRFEQSSGSHSPADPTASTSRSTHTNSSHKNARSAQAPPTHGNFVGYYTKRPRTDGGDARLALAPREWIQGKRVLDVGCNTGQVTVELAQALGAAEVVGVDIDSELIKLARRHVDLAWSRQAPLPHLIEAAEKASAAPSRDAPPHQRPAKGTHSTFSQAPPAPPSSTTHFPIALPRMYGYLSHPPRDLMIHNGAKAFPENVKFRAADWAAEGIAEDREAYDLILALSITKWIHLNTLNAGLLKFFRRLHRSLKPGGKLVLEPQPFSSYAKSARLSDELKANLDILRDGEPRGGEEREDGGEEGEGDGKGKGEKGWREEDGDFERVLLEVVGFERKERLGETGEKGEKGFQRPVDVYFKGDKWA